VEKVGGEKFSTNNRMELMAVIVALENSLEYKKDNVVVFSDSTYVVKAVNEGWLKNWLVTNFKKKKNEDLWRRFHQVYVQFSNIDFQWVQGHGGNFYNERCDKLARNFSKNFFV
jgi:ribonuclease HI